MPSLLSNTTSNFFALAGTVIDLRLKAVLNAVTSNTGSPLSPLFSNLRSPWAAPTLPAATTATAATAATATSADDRSRGRRAAMSDRPNSTRTAITRAPAVEPFSGSASSTRDTAKAMLSTSTTIPTGRATGTSTRSSRRALRRSVQAACSRHTWPSQPPAGIRAATTAASSNRPSTAVPTAARPSTSAPASGQGLGRAADTESTTTVVASSPSAAGSGTGSPIVAPLTTSATADAPTNRPNSRNVPARSPTAAQYPTN